MSKDVPLFAYLVEFNKIYRSRQSIQQRALSFIRRSICELFNFVLKTKKENSISEPLLCARLRCRTAFGAQAAQPRLARRGCGPVMRFLKRSIRIIREYRLL